MHVHDGPQAAGLGEEAEAGLQQSGASCPESLDLPVRHFSKPYPIEVLSATENRVGRGSGPCSNPGGSPVRVALTCSPDATGLPSPGAQDTGSLCYRALHSAGWDWMGPLGERPHILTRGVSRGLLGASERSRTISPGPQLPAGLS